MARRRHRRHQVCTYYHDADPTTNKTRTTLSIDDINHRPSIVQRRRQLPPATGDNDVATSTSRQRLRQRRGNHQWQPWPRSTVTAMALAPALSSEDDQSKLQLVRRSDDDVWPCLMMIVMAATFTPSFV